MTTLAVLPVGPMVVSLLVLAALTLPGLLALRSARRVHGRREAALRLHRARLDALGDEERTGLIAPEEQQAARLEIQRRLLAEVDRAEDGLALTRKGSSERNWLLATAMLVPLASAGLYLVVGHPLLPSAPIALRQKAAQTDPDVRRDAVLTQTLRDRLSTLDPASPQAVTGYTLLGRVEATQGHWAEAAAAWRVAIRARFDPALAVSAAEAHYRATGRVDAPSAALLRRALADGPPDATWRMLAQERLVEAETAPH